MKINLKRLSIITLIWLVSFGTAHLAFAGDYVMTPHVGQMIVKEQPSEITLHFSKPDGTPLTPDDLKEVHTKILHLLVIDPGLSDYHHIHPEPTETAGQWAFRFTPNTDGPYRLWADITPKASNKQIYLHADIGPDWPKNPAIDRTVSTRATLGTYTFDLSFDQPLRSGQAALATVRVSDAQGQPVKKLEPVLGAFAHAVGFSEDGQSVAHAHPLGKEPTTDAERGGPELQFHVEAPHSGFLKLYVQFKIDGADVFVPFGLSIQE
jgi:hypothetical protein